MRVKYNKIKYVPFQNLPGAEDFEGTFSFLNENAHLTIVDAMQVLEEVNKVENPELYAAIDALKSMDFIGFDA
jgi:uncharacterized protein YhdP